ncbi:MAG: quinone-dependent dihydroorotate dehydrogenase [Deltaproteobacteria bacterium]
MIEKLGLKLIYRLDPEAAHGMAIRALNMGLVSRPGPVSSDRLKTTLAGLDLLNPIGLAAGFDKNAVAVAPLMRTGFGFLEIGAATPRPQPGNPKPRLFRLDQDRAAINRFGFNNDGADVIAVRLANRPKGVPVGINLGANKDSADRMADFESVLRVMAGRVDFATVNISSPNTQGLRDLQAKDDLARLLDRMKQVEAGVPLFLKIAPDLTISQLQDVADVAVAAGIDALICTNTTLDRIELHGPHAAETGGLSGKPLFTKSTAVLGLMAELTGGKLPLIGVGGITSGQDAYDKIRAGASAVQLYTALVFEGFSLVPKIARDVDDLLRRDGFTNVSDAVGLDRDLWASRAHEIHV